MGWSCLSSFSIASQYEVSGRCVHFCRIGIAEAVDFLNLIALQESVCYILPLLCGQVSQSMSRWTMLLDAAVCMPCWDDKSSL